MYNPPPPPNISPTVYKPPQKGLCHNISPGLNYGILRDRSLLKLNDFITKFASDLTVIWYFLKSIISIWDTLKWTHFFCLITSSNQTSSSCCCVLLCQKKLKHFLYVTAKAVIIYFRVKLILLPVNNSATKSCIHTSGKLNEYYV